MNEIICFHNPDEDYGWLSNWYISPFTLDEVQFSTVEQYMMYRKAVLFEDAKIAEMILNEDDPSRIKQLGRQVSGYNDLVWNGCRQIVVYQGLLAKFIQNVKLGEMLKGTGKTVLAECAVKDTIWGIGLSMHDSSRFQMEKWKGHNLLGFALMQVREQIR